MSCCVETWRVPSGILAYADKLIAIGHSALRSILCFRHPTPTPLFPIPTISPSAQSSSLSAAYLSHHPIQSDFAPHLLFIYLQHLQQLLHKPTTFTSDPFSSFRFIENFGNTHCFNVGTKRLNVTDANNWDYVCRKRYSEFFEYRHAHHSTLENMPIEPGSWQVQNVHDTGLVWWRWVELWQFVDLQHSRPHTHRCQRHWRTRDQSSELSRSD